LTTVAFFDYVLENISGKRGCFPTPHRAPICLPQTIPHQKKMSTPLRTRQWYDFIMKDGGILAAGYGENLFNRNQALTGENEKLKGKCNSKYVIGMRLEAIATEHR
jgi:hypothetical protein